LLGYTPTYFHFPKPKDKRNMPEELNLRKLASFEFKAKKAALDASSQYKVTDPSIPGLGGPSAPPKRVKKKAPSSKGPVAKKAKATEASLSKGASTAEASSAEAKANMAKPNPSKEKAKVVVSEADMEVLRQTYKPEEISTFTTVAPFKPSLVSEHGHIVNVEDSVAKSSEVAITLLRGLSLPKDAAAVPFALEENMAELCQLVARVIILSFITVQTLRIFPFISNTFHLLLRSASMLPKPTRAPW
jgi:hypothetical protein